VQGLLPYKDGLIATTRTQILFVRDTNGDGVADERKPLVAGFNPNHSQLQVSAPRWGLDGFVYFNNGLDTKEIYPADSTDKKQNFARCNLRWDPATGKLEPSTGFGQFGGCFDDWGRHFFCSNRSPVMFAVMPYEAVIRNPNAGITQGWEDIAPSGADSKIHPLAITHTTADAHAGTHTAACGLGVYRGDLIPELRGEIFVCEPTAQAVIRYHPEPKGASLKATRVGDHTEFFRSRDEWTRPVNATTGPDGALYVCDMYRQYIDHARFFPESFSTTHDMRLGENEGRIWRIVPRGAGAKKARTIEAAPKKVEELVAWLGNENAWQRETAQRLLGDVSANELKAVVAALVQQKPNALLSLHAQALRRTLDKAGPDGQKTALPDLTEEEKKGLVATLQLPNPPEDLVDAVVALRPSSSAIKTKTGAGYVDRGQERAAMLWIAMTNLSDADAKDKVDGIMQVFVSALQKYPEDVWIHRAVMSSSSQYCGRILSQYLGSANLGKAGFTAVKSDMIRVLASCAAADANQDDFASALSVLQSDKGSLAWWKPAVLQGLSEGLPKSGGKLGAKSLALFTSKPPEAYKDAADEITALLAQVDKVMIDPTAAMEQRLACLPLLAQRKWDDAEPAMRKLLADGQPLELSSAALTLLKKFPADKTAPLLYELLPKLGPAPRAEVVKMLTGNGKTVKDFFERIDRGELPKAFVDAETRWRYLRPNNPLYALAEKIFGKPSEDRAAVITAYADAIKAKGDPAKGHQIFSTVCIACHRLKGEGVDVAPDITDVKIKEKEALLSDILDPNRMVEARWMAYQIDTKDGRIVSGIIAAETSSEVTIKMAGGLTEAIPRSNIARMKSLDASLMPVGLEAGISKEQMADLLAFLKGE
jgi:putative membrane-bound dehydrogenase-like protein